MKLHKNLTIATKEYTEGKKIKFVFNTPCTYDYEFIFWGIWNQLITRGGSKINSNSLRDYYDYFTTKHPHKDGFKYFILFRVNVVGTHEHIPNLRNDTHYPIDINFTYQFSEKDSVASYIDNPTKSLFDFINFSVKHLKKVNTSFFHSTLFSFSHIVVDVTFRQMPIDKNKITKDMKKKMRYLERMNRKNNKDNKDNRDNRD